MFGLATQITQKTILGSTYVRFLENNDLLYMCNS